MCDVREDEETSEETVGALPAKWINVEKKIVWWPSDEKLVLKSYKNKEAPGQDWKTFQLVKVKVRSGNGKFMCELKYIVFSSLSYSVLRLSTSCNNIS